MKNKGIIKAIIVTVILTLLLTWLIPSSTVGAEGAILGKVLPKGFFDVLLDLQLIPQVFSSEIIFILLVGAFYGVINKSGDYKAVVDKIVELFKKEAWVFVIITVAFYGFTTALTGMYIPMFIFLPLSLAILNGLKYNKVQSLLATIGATTVGLIAQLSSATIKTVTNATSNTYLWVKFGLFIVLLATTVMYILKSKKEVKKETAKEIETTSMFVPTKRLAQKDRNPKGILLLIFLFLIFVMLVLGLNYWTDVTVFSNALTNIKDVKINDFAILGAILGSKTELLGRWSLYSVYGLLVVTILTFSLFSKLKFKEMLDGALEGAKKVFKIAIVISLISLVLVFMLDSKFMVTVVEYITRSGSVFSVSLTSFIGSPFMIDRVYASSYLLQLMAILLPSGNVELFGLIVQVAYGFVMLIVPTSLLLVMGLVYTEVEYKNWFKYTWRYLSISFGLVITTIFLSANLSNPDLIWMLPLWLFGVAAFTLVTIFHRIIFEKTLKPVGLYIFNKALKPIGLFVAKIFKKIGIFFVSLYKKITKKDAENIKKKTK